MSGFHQKYKVLQKIGEGSFAEVVKCEEISSGKLFAAKRLKKVYRSEKETASCAEMIAMQKLRYHQNIIRMIEYFYDHLTGRLTFVLELMDTSLYDYIKKKKRCVSEMKAKYFLYQLLKGLEHLHRSGLFHRDVKPENVLLKLPAFGSSREIVKLADMGSIRGIYSTPPYTEYISTRWYRPPECLLTAGHYGSKMDIWATGCVFYEMFTLKPLFPGTDEIDQLSRIHSVLGTPSSNLLNKLKSKSKNCEYFPRQQGSGLHAVAKSLSENGVAVLKLMVQYDPDRRISAKRLVDHPYFKDLREIDTTKKYPMISISQEFTPHQNKGDFATSPNLHSFAMKHKPVLSSKNTHSAIKKSKTSVNMLDYEIPLVPKSNNLSGGGRPVARKSEMRSWGVNPYILSPKTKNDEPMASPIQGIKAKKWLKKRENHQQGFVFSKTTSQLPQLHAGITEQSGTKKTDDYRFLSKSFTFSREKDPKAKFLK